MHIHTIKNNIHVEVRFTLTRALAEGYVNSMFSCAFVFVKNLALITFLKSNNYIKTRFRRFESVCPCVRCMCVRFASFFHSFY